MVRDPLKTKKYFDEYIEFEEEEGVEDRINDIDNSESFSPEILMKKCVGIVRDGLTILILRYSRGDAIADMKSDLDRLLKYRKLQKEYADALPDQEQSGRVQWERLVQHRYDEYLHWLAFAVGVGMNQQYFRDTLALMNNEGLDQLFDRIAVQLGDAERPIGDKALYTPYGELLKVLDAEPAQRPHLMRRYLDNWYDACKDRGWHDLHIKGDDTYYGYWCFEAALVAKLFDIDDSSFCDHRHYPAALVHGD